MKSIKLTLTALAFLPIAITAVSCNQENKKENKQKENKELAELKEFIASHSVEKLQEAGGVLENVKEQITTSLDAANILENEKQILKTDLDVYKEALKKASEATDNTKASAAKLTLEAAYNTLLSKIVIGTKKPAPSTTEYEKAKALMVTYDYGKLSKYDLTLKGDVEPKPEEYGEGFKVVLNKYLMPFKKAYVAIQRLSKKDGEAKAKELADNLIKTAEELIAKTVIGTSKVPAQLGEAVKKYSLEKLQEAGGILYGVEYVDTTVASADLPAGKKQLSNANKEKYIKVYAKANRLYINFSKKATIKEMQEVIPELEQAVQELKNNIVIGTKAN
ncbi:Uncharacterised protein [Mycoplasmopsis californica]|uniref:Lipoprotein n=1 Tax=Mycoplasmopsis equigenitalium TaxID=114883 RepID=A0ABY5J2J1_9BACT|nr:hypothetical protein [Mycoplasmopsis equigenitalium]UUD36939.1 hypothetical protein NPA09_03505 [Mycoplasmopsis equigenitalium]VEU69766.1 Uncharacterised protein [Mycoplasmopsis californica]